MAVNASVKAVERFNDSIVACSEPVSLIMPRVSIERDEMIDALYSRMIDRATVAIRTRSRTNSVERLQLKESN